MTPDEIRSVLNSAAVLEQLAAIEHERWAHWQHYLHEQCEQLSDGSLRLPAHLVDRWETQIDTPYTQLSDSEKESDRDQVRRYLSTLAELMTR